MAAQAPEKGWQPPEDELLTPPVGEDTPFEIPPEEEMAAVEGLAEADDFDHVGFALANPESVESMFQVDKKLKVRSFGEKAGDFTGGVGRALGKPLETGLALGKGAIDFTLGLAAPAYHTASRLGHEAGGYVSRKLGRTEHAEMSEREALRHKAEAVISGQKIETNTRNVARIAGNLLEGAMEDLPAQQKEEDDRQDFLARVETRRKREQLAQSKPLDEGWVATLSKIIDSGPELLEEFKRGGALPKQADLQATIESYRPSELYSPKALQATGAPPVRQWLTDTMATGADPTNLLLRPGMSLPGARQAAGAALEGVGALAQAPGALLGGLPGRYGRGVSAGAALGETVLTQSFPMTSAKVAAVVAGIKGLQKVGKLLQMQGKELRTGQPSELTTRIATKRIGGERPALADVTGRTVADAVGTGGQAAIGLAPLNLALSEGNPEEFIQLEGIAGTFGGLHRLGAGGRRMLIEGARPFLRSEGARTLDTSTPLGEKSARFIMSLPDGIRDMIFETIGMFQGLPAESAGGKRTDAKVYVLSHADYLRQVAKVSDAAVSGGDGFAVAEDGTAYIDGEQTTQRGNTQETLGHEVGGHIGPTIVRAMGRKGAPLWEAVTKSAMEGLFKNGKPTEDFQKFIDAYNKAYDPTGETKRLDPTKPESLEEYVAETAGKIIRGEGAASLALPKNILNRINDGIVKLSGRLFGVDTEKVGGETSFDLQEVGEITQAVREMLTGIADARFRGPEGPSAVPAPPEAAPRTPPEAPGGVEPPLAQEKPVAASVAPAQAVSEARVGAVNALNRLGIPKAQEWVDSIPSAPGESVDQIFKEVMARRQDLRTPKATPPGIVPPLARVANEQAPKEPLPGRAPVLQDVAVAGVPAVVEAPRDAGVSKVDQVEPEALTHYPPQSPEHGRVAALVAYLGQVVRLKSRAASKRDESKEYSAKERAKELTPVDKREEVTFDDMAFIPMKVQLGKKGVYSRGFAPEQAVRNLDALLEQAAREGVTTPFDGLKGVALDNAVEDAYHRYNTNQQHGYDGTGTKPLRKPGPGYDYLPEPDPKGVLPLDPEIADLINASMGVRDVKGTEGEKADALSRENQGPREGGKIANRFLQKLKGLDPDILDDPFRTAVNVETVRGEISPAEGEGRSIRPSGINVDYTKAFPFKPQFEAVAAGFRPKTGKERIKAAAFRLKDGSIWTGQTHFRIQDDSGFKKRATSLGGVEEFSDAVSGFVTESGRFVDSEEAYTISKAAKQLMQDEGDFNAKAEDLRIDQNLEVKEQKGAGFRPKETPPTEEKLLSTFKRQIEKEPPLSGLGQFRPKTKEQEAYEERLIKDPATTAKMLENKRGVSVLNADDIAAKSPDAISYTLEQSMDAYPERHAGFAKPGRDAALTYLLGQPFQRNGRVIMTSGGPGSGKSTTTNLLGKPDLIYDTNLGSYVKDKEKLEEILASGRIVDVVRVVREVGDAMRGNLERGPVEKRVVSADVLAQAHVSSSETFQRLYEEYKSDPRVTFKAYRNIRDQVPVEIPLEEVSVLKLEETRKRVYSVLDEVANGKDPQWTKLPLPKSVLDVARGASQGSGRGLGEGDVRTGRGDEGIQAPRGALEQVPGDPLSSPPLARLDEAPVTTEVTRANEKAPLTRVGRQGELRVPESPAGDLGQVRPEAGPQEARPTPERDRPEALPADGGGDVQPAGGSFRPKTLRFEHYSNRPEKDLILDPAFHGSGKVGAERARRRDYPELYINRIYLGLPGYKKEQGLPPNKHSGKIDSDLLYDITDDPLNLMDLAWKRVREGKEYAALDRQAALTTFEKLVRDAGFLGYQWPDYQSAAIFHKIPANGNVDMAHFAEVAPGFARRSPEMFALVADSVPGFEKIKESYWSQSKAGPEQTKRQSQIAQEYEALALDNLADPKVKRSYEALSEVLQEQAETLQESGIKAEAWAEKKDGKWVSKPGQPYRNSAELQRDLRENKRLFFFVTEPGTFGGSGRLPESHPMLQDSGRKTPNGYPLLNNDILRYVHDAIAHGSFGVEFGPAGEEAAWRAHMATIQNPWARWALTTETRGQNSWVNFRKDLLDKDGQPLKPGDKGYIPPQDRPFGDQKVDLLPAGRLLTGEPTVDQVALGDAEFVKESGLKTTKESGSQFRPTEQMELIPEEAELAGVPRGKGIALAKKLWREKGTDSPFFQRWFGQSKAVDEKGQPIVVRHGTMKRFNAFDEEKASPMSDMGPGFYFTTHPSDASANYASANSPDLNARIALLTERIFEERAGVHTYPQAEKLARKELMGKIPIELDMYLKIENPLVLGPENGFKFTQELDLPGSAEKLFDAIRDVAPKYDANPDILIRELKDPGKAFSRRRGIWSEKLFSFEKHGYISAEQALDTLKSSNAWEYSDDPNASTKAITDIVKALGHDGIKIENAEERYGGLQMERGTDHYIVYEPTQVKSVRNKGTFDESDKRFNFRPSTEEKDPIFNFSKIESKAPLANLFDEEKLTKLHRQSARLVRQKKMERFPEALPLVYRKTEDGKIAVDKKGLPIVEPQEYDFLETPVAKAAMVGIRGEESRRAAAAAALGDEMVKEFEAHQDNPQVMAGRKWYQIVRKKLRKEFKEDAEFMAQLLAATSAQTGVKDNYKYAIDALNQFNDGKFIEPVTRYLDALPKLVAGELKFLRGSKKGEIVTPKTMREWVEVEEILPLQSNGKKFGLNSYAVLRVISGNCVRGQKVENFAQNMVSGEGNEATVDVWAARTLRRLGYQGSAKPWRILPQAERAVNEADFDLAQEAYRHAAEKIGDMNPDDLQGVMWFAEKSLWRDKGWTRGAGAELSDFHSLIDQTKTIEGRKVLDLSGTPELSVVSL